MAQIEAGQSAEAIDSQRAQEVRAAKENARRAEQAAASIFLESPLWLGQGYLRDGNWKALEELVHSLATSGRRDQNGQFELNQLVSGIASTFSHVDESNDEMMVKGLLEYQHQFPKSAFAPILRAMQLHGTAWRARGFGNSASGTSAGWSLYAERSRQAWQNIMAVRSSSDRLPVWYEQAIKIGIDANVSDGELFSLTQEGIKRFPGYHEIYDAILRKFSPRWGGNYDDADRFIRSQVAASTNSEGEVLYTILYWQLDGYDGMDRTFFERTHVEWSRMRTGFEKLLDTYQSPRNLAAFASYACRAGDASTYLRLRQNIDKAVFEEGAPMGISLEVCDGQFRGKH